jgi:hypothetical protein
MAKPLDFLSFHYNQSTQKSRKNQAENLVLQRITFLQFLQKKLLA